jgi:hypothetical protein
VDNPTVIRGWSNPSVPCDVAFEDIAFGKKVSSGEGRVEFNIKVLPGTTHKIAVGFCEGQQKKPGIRIMDIRVEGAQHKVIDPARDFGLNKPGIYLLNAKDVDKNGILTVVVSNAPGSKDRNVFINGIWMFENDFPSSQTIISGKANKEAELYAACADVPMPERCYHMLITLKNTINANTIFHPVIRYVGIEKLEKENGAVKIGNQTLLASSQTLDDVIMDSANAYTIRLKPLRLAPKQQKKMIITIRRFYDPAHNAKPVVANSQKQKELAFKWWQQHGPSDEAIQVPDSGIQAMLQSCIRNIFQARNIEEGKPVFNVGPTIFHGLWIADGSFILETATMLNYIAASRNCIDYLSRNELPGGGFKMITNLYKENGFVIYMLTRHAALTEDKHWLASKWKTIEGCIKYMMALHRQALKDSSKPYFGLMPPGFVDGGISYGHKTNDYSNTEWCLSGMKMAIKAARWLGKEQEAALWEKEYSNFLSYFIKAAQKGLQRDDKGNIYLPVLINNEKQLSPQKGQWAFCQTVYPGELFDETPGLHQIAEGTLSMLSDHRKEGLVTDVGYLNGGLWTYFSSFYGHALEWLGRGKEMPPLLYAFANHSSPTLDWWEDQMPKGMGDQVAGDMPHNWASAGFIRMLVHMIELDRGNELHLFEGLPKEWLKPGAETRLNGILTPFGPISLTLKVNSKGDADSLNLIFHKKGHLPRLIVVH